MNTKKHLYFILFLILILGTIFSALKIITYIKQSKTTDNINAAIPEPVFEEVEVTHPTLGYSLVYPSSWSLVGDEYTPEGEGRYKDFIIHSPDYLIEETGYPTIVKGAEIRIIAVDSQKENLEEIFSENTLTKEIAQNINDVVVKGVPAISYNYNYEMVNATHIIFLENNIFYTVAFYYTDDETRDKYTNTYQSILESLKVSPSTP